MALLTDGIPNTTETLRAYETEILSLANVERIDLDAKLKLALDEISFDVLDVLLDHGRTTDPLALVRRTTGVSDVVVTPQLKRWHALHTLEIVYRDAFNNQLNDRYQSKWDEYRNLSREGRDQTVSFGLGLVSVPVPRATAPIFSSVAGASPGTVYYASMSWVGANGQEGAPSLTTTYQTTDGSLLNVSAPTAPTGVTGWNLYVGLTDLSLTLQNSTPEGLAQSFTLGTPMSGAAPGDGQAAEIWIIGGRSLRRG